MALIRCGECSKDISDQAVACPHCGAPANAAKPPADKKLGCWPIGFLILGGLLVVGMFAGSPNKSGPKTDNDACYMAQSFVKDRLKAPATAEFSSCLDSGTTVTKVGEFWTVSGSVDSQNSFGAKIRSNYRVTLKFIGDDKWQAPTVQID